MHPDNVDAHSAAVAGLGQQGHDVLELTNKQTYTLESCQKPAPLSNRQGDEFDGADEAHAKSREFNLDLAPKLLLAAGALTALLARSGVARYLEFHVGGGCVL